LKSSHKEQPSVIRLLSVNGLVQMPFSLRCVQYMMTSILAKSDIWVHTLYNADNSDALLPMPNVHLIGQQILSLAKLGG